MTGEAGLARRADGLRQRIRQGRRSFRLRVVAIAAAAVVLVLVLTGASLVLVQRKVLTENLESTLSHRADALNSLIVAGDLPPTIEATGDDDDVAQVVALDGTVVSATSNIVGFGPIADGPPPDRRQILRTVENFPVDDEHPFRLLTRRVGPMVVHVAANLDDIEESTRVLTGSLIIAIPAVAVLLAALLWWLVGRSLRPVEAIRAEVADIGGRDLHRRVPEPRGDDEIARLARTMNGMLDRVENAVGRQQRFVADASHELRSPLTRIRTEIEVDLARPDDSDPVTTHRSVLDEIVGLQRLVEDLLHLARTDAGDGNGDGTRSHETIDLDDIVLRQIRRLRSAGRVEVDSSGVNAAQVHGDADQLVRVVNNVFDNAARWATRAIVVTLAEREEERVAVLTVTDDGPGIPADQHERVFDRFARLDDARAATAGGTGLGLAIARDIVQRHGGAIAVDPDWVGGARFVIVLPLSSVR